MVWRFDFDFKVGSHFFFIVECFDFYFLCFFCSMAMLFLLSDFIVYFFYFGGQGAG
jgi:hypothetical protein